MNNQMKKKTILLLHGFASSGNSTKAKYLREKFKSLPQAAFFTFDFNPAPGDFEYMTLTGLINRLRQYIVDHHSGEVSLIGSSMGALVGLHYAHRFGGVNNMLFLAPALSYLSNRLTEAELQRWKEEGVFKVSHYAFKEEIPLRYDYHTDGMHYLKPVPPAAPIKIIHGLNDEVVPIDNSRNYAANFADKVELIKLDSDHSLNDRLDFIWEQVRSFLLN